MEGGSRNKTRTTWFRPGLFRPWLFGRPEIGDLRGVDSADWLENHPGKKCTHGGAALGLGKDDPLNLLFVSFAELGDGEGGAHPSGWVQLSHICVSVRVLLQIALANGSCHHPHPAMMQTELGPGERVVALCRLKGVSSITVGRFGGGLHKSSISLDFSVQVSGTTLGSVARLNSAIMRLGPSLSLGLNNFEKSGCSGSNGESPNKLAKDSFAGKPEAVWQLDRTCGPQGLLSSSLSLSLSQSPGQGSHSSSLPGKARRGIDDNESD